MAAEGQVASPHSRRRNPLNPTALRACDIRVGMKFIWYQPPPSPWKRGGWPYSKWYFRKLMERHDPKIQWGEFTSEPYLEDGEYYVVDCIIGEPKGEQRTEALYSLGIVNSRFDSDEWAPCICRAR